MPEYTVTIFEHVWNRQRVVADSYDEAIEKALNEEVATWHEVERSLEGVDVVKSGAE